MAKIMKTGMYKKDKGLSFKNFVPYSSMRPWNLRSLAYKQSITIKIMASKKHTTAKKILVPGYRLQKLGY